ncbi:MAG: NAD(P)H-binding protein [Gallionellaceae bacterium]|jgi:uncharacterized protein YbjT (DUF2867 family)|nr:NAD(P)H-binding protein [Gallionellaceae bacterium]
MNILLTGASGFIGRNIAAALVRAGHQVRLVSRRHGVDVNRMLAPADWLTHLDGVDAVVNSIGIIGETSTQRFVTLHTKAPIALFDACVRAGVRRVVQISALGADETAFSAYHLSKRTADDHLRTLDLDWFVLRPSLIYGLGGTSAALFMRLAKLPLIPVIGDGQQRLQPLHISDLTAAVLHSLTTTESPQTLDVAGAEIITYAEWLQRMREAQGLPRALLLPIPLNLALAFAYLGRRFSPMLSPENLRMLNAGSHTDAQALTRFLGRPPHPFEPRLFFSDASTPRETP